MIIQGSSLPGSSLGTRMCKKLCFELKQELFGKCKYALNLKLGSNSQSHFLNIAVFFNLVKEIINYV